MEDLVDGARGVACEPAFTMMECYDVVEMPVPMTSPSWTSDGHSGYGSL